MKRNNYKLSIRDREQRIRKFYWENKVKKNKKSEFS